jgi:hypothetical protein
MAVDLISFSLTNRFATNSDTIFLYDENGNIIGIDQSKVSQDNAQTDVLKYMEQKNDAFVREEEAKAEEANVAKKKQNIISEEHKVVKSVVSDVLEKISAGGYDVFKREASDINMMAEKLTSANASNTTVIESVKKFQSKAKELEEEAQEYKEKTKAEDKKESIFSLETKEEKEQQENKIEVYRVEEDLLANNPFYKSALETSEKEDMVLDK